MLFNSLQFLFFFAVVFFGYYNIVPPRYRWLFLLAASCYFYMAYIPAFVLILWFLITVDYILGIAIHRAQGRERTLLLIVSICTNLSTLFFFKYFNFFSENIADIAALIHWNYTPLLLQIALPLGLSFHVFQSLSYVIEVYKGKQEPERHYGIYALYVMFFPQLVAGPIERPQHLLHQLHKEHRFDPIMVRQGLELMLWGFFKKLVIADRLSQIVDSVYSRYTHVDGLTLCLAAILFTYQIYCDFSGYSDIAVGAARVLGYDLTKNFNRPFAARSIPEFWRRWHISLSSWLKDYLYYPLVFSGKSVTKVRLYVSVLVTFTLIGLWHGANWTYVVFGALHGIFSALSQITQSIRQRIRTVTYIDRFKFIQEGVQILITFALVTIAFIFFRAASVSDALSICSTILVSLFHPTDLIRAHDIGMPLTRFATVVVAIGVMELVQYIQSVRGTLYIFDGYTRAVRWLWYYTLILSILMLGYLQAQSFIYFRF